MFGSTSKGLAGVNEQMAYAALRQQTGMNANANTVAVQNLRSSYEEGKAGRDAGAANIRSDADQSYINGTPVVGQLGGSSLAALQGRNQRVATNEMLGARISDVTGYQDRQPGQLHEKQQSDCRKIRAGECQDQS
jgi:hypothetical protein